MKIFSKITMAVLALGLTVALFSCGKDDDKACYECPEYDDGFGSTVPAETYCESDSVTAQQLDAAILLIEAFAGIDCEKQ